MPKEKYRFYCFIFAQNNYDQKAKDFIHINFNTKEIDDYGRITLKVTNANSKI